MDNLKEKKVSFKKFLIVLCLTIVITSFAVWQVAQSTPTSSPYYLDSAESESSYTIFYEDSLYKAKNQSSGQIDFQSTNVTAVWEQVRDSLPSGGTGFFKIGTYTFTAPFTSKNNVPISIEGEGISDPAVSGKGTEFIYDGVAGVDIFDFNSGGYLNNQAITLKNFGLKVASGKSTGTIGIDLTNVYMADLENIVITSTDDNQAGSVGVSSLTAGCDHLTMKNVRTVGFETGFDTLQDWVTMIKCGASMGKYGFLIHGGTCVGIGIHANGQAADGRGFYISFAYSGGVTLISPYSENANSLYDYSINVVSSATVVIINLRSYRTPPVMYINEALNVKFIGGMFVTENFVTSTNTTATTFVFNHGLAGTADYVFASFNTTAISGWSWTSTSTQVTITVAGTSLPAIMTCYAEVKYVP